MVFTNQRRREKEKQKREAFVGSEEKLWKLKSWYLRPKEGDGN